MKQREKEEGNRLLYVAMTRAEEQLAMSYTMTGKKPQNWAAIVAERLPVRSADEPPPRPKPRALAEVAASTELLPLPTLTAQYDSQATVTSIAMFHDCPRRYYLSRYCGAGSQPAPASQAAPFSQSAE